MGHVGVVNTCRCGIVNVINLTYDQVITIRQLCPLSLGILHVCVHVHVLMSVMFLLLGEKFLKLTQAWLMFSLM